MNKSITFTEDFATKKKGEVWVDCDYQLASQLVNVDKVAVYTEPLEIAIEETKVEEMATTEEVVTTKPKKGK